MTIAFDAVTQNTRTGTGTTQSFTHTPTGTPRAITAAFTHGASDTEWVTSATYGGVAMTPVISAADSAGEPGRCSLFFLGSSIPTGAQTITFNLSSGTTDDTHATCVSWTADADCEVIDSDKVEGDAENPSVTLSSAGRHSASFSGLYAGGDSTGTVNDGTGVTRTSSGDLGAWVSLTGRQTTPGTGDFTFGWTMTSDDVAMAALMFAEVQAASASRLGLLLGIG